MAGLSQDETNTKQQRKRRLIDEAPCAGIDVGVSGQLPQQESHTSDEECDGKTEQNNAILPQLYPGSTARLSGPYKDDLEVPDICAGGPVRIKSPIWSKKR